MLLLTLTLLDAVLPEGLAHSLDSHALPSDCDHPVVLVPVQQFRLVTIQGDVDTTAGAKANANALDAVEAMATAQSTTGSGGVHAPILFTKCRLVPILMVLLFLG